MISKSEALDRLTPDQIDLVLQPYVDPAACRQLRPLAKGKLACPGVVSGILVTDIDEAEDRALNGESIILARPTTNPDDVHAMLVVAGVLTELGGSTSHAAVVSREIGVPCIVGCGEGRLLGLEGQTVTVDAAAGVIYAGALPIIAAGEDQNADLTHLAQWARSEFGAVSNQSLQQLLANRKRH